MAALTYSNVRIVKAWVDGNVVGKRRKVRRVEVYGGEWGDGTDTMPATAFGLSVIEEVTSATYGTTGYMMAPASDGSKAYVYAINGAGAPATVTVPTTPGGLYFTVKGY